MDVIECAVLSDLDIFTIKCFFEFFQGRRSDFLVYVDDGIVEVSAFDQALVEQWLELS